MLQVGVDRWRHIETLNLMVYYLVPHGPEDGRVGVVLIQKYILCLSNEGYSLF